MIGGFRSYFRFHLMPYIHFILSIVTVSCMLYVVMWLEALRKGWLV